MLLGKVNTIFAGKVENLTRPDGAPFPSAIRKRQISACKVGFDGLERDESSEDVHHTPDKEVHLFSFEHYEPISERLGIPLERPTFGENLSTLGINESNIFVGDRLEIGNVHLEITQPTERCKTIGNSLGEPRILKVLHQLEVCGFYAKVLKPGVISNSDPISLIERQQEEWSILRLHQFMFKKLTDDALLEEVLAIPQLSDEWKNRFPKMRERAARGEALSSSLAAIENL